MADKKQVPHHPAAYQKAPDSVLSTDSLAHWHGHLLHIASVSIPHTVTTKYGLQWLCGWQDSCQPRLCNFLQFGDATFSKNTLQLFPKSACKKHHREFQHNFYVYEENGLSHTVSISDGKAKVI